MSEKESEARFLWRPNWLVVAASITTMVTVIGIGARVLLWAGSNEAEMQALKAQLTVLISNGSPAVQALRERVEAIDREALENAHRLERLDERLGRHMENPTQAVKP